MIRISALSRERISIPVSMIPPGDMSTKPIQFAFPSMGVAPSVWANGVWISGVRQQFATALVGPGGTFVLTVGYYDIWLDDPPELVTDKVGTLHIV
jgi:hypothetical protein